MFSRLVSRPRSLGLFLLVAALLSGLSAPIHPVAASPTPPTGLDTAASDSKVSLSWTRQGSFSYQVRFKPAGSSTWSYRSAGVTDRLTISGLENGVTYEFRVRVKTGSLASAYSPPSLATPHPITVRFISPTPAGTQDGSSWDNSAGLGKLNALIAASSPGDEVWLRADGGAYMRTGQLTLSHGGSASGRVTIRGVAMDGSPAKAVISSTRVAPYVPGGATGSEIFRLMPGADHLRFADLRFENIGNGAFRIGGPATDLVIEDIDASNVKRFIENYVSGSQTSASITQMVVRRVAVRGFSLGVVRLRYDSSNIRLEDVRGDSEHQDRDDFAIGVSMDGTVHDVSVRRVHMDNILDTVNAYRNGDGFATERGVYRVSIAESSASGSTDSGFDLKSTATTLTDVYAEGNKRNFRFWGEIQATRLTAVEPIHRGGSGNQAQIWLAKGANVTIDQARISDVDPSTTVFSFDGPAQLTVTSSAVTLGAYATLHSNVSSLPNLVTTTVTRI